jgi:hypothetical protein
LGSPHESNYNSVSPFARKPGAQHAIELAGMARAPAHLSSRAPHEQDFIPGISATRGEESWRFRI